MADRLTIQRFPKGLLGLLGMQVGGDTPQALAPDTQGVVDMLDFYTADLRKTTQISQANITAAGQLITTSVVPNGEIWLMRDFSFQSTAAAPAATAAQLVIGHVQNFTGAGLLFPLAESEQIGPGDSSIFGKHFERPDVWLPGDGVFLFCNRMTAGGPISAIFLNMAYSRVLI